MVLYVRPSFSIWLQCNFKFISSSKIKFESIISTTFSSKHRVILHINFLKFTRCVTLSHFHLWVFTTNLPPLSFKTIFMFHFIYMCYFCLTAWNKALYRTEGLKHTPHLFSWFSIPISSGEFKLSWESGFQRLERQNEGWILCEEVSLRSGLRVCKDA
jgi:hypothetical protein